MLANVSKNASFCCDYFDVRVERICVIIDIKVKIKFKIKCNIELVFSIPSR